MLDDAGVIYGKTTMQDEMFKPGELLSPLLEESHKKVQMRSYHI